MSRRGQASHAARRVWAAALTLLITAPSNAAAVQSAQPSLARIDSDAHRQTIAYDLLKDLTSRIGPRLTGSAKGRQAEVWAFKAFRAAGYADVRFAPFHFDGWARGPLHLTIASSPVPAVALGGSPARVDFQGEIVNADNGIDEDYARNPDLVRGKIALVYYTALPDSPDTTPLVPRWDKIKLAIAHGAKGLIFINRGHGNTLSTGTAWFDGTLPIPVLMIGHEQGLALRERLKQSALPVTLAMTNTIGPATARNVIAILPGTDPGADRIVFGAHLDSWDLATGALDNGAGATSVIDIARLFKRNGYRPRRTIEFVVYMGEEQGDLGSSALVEQQARSGSAGHIGYAVNSDMSYDPVALDSWGFPVDAAWYRTLTAGIAALRPGFAKDVVGQPMPGGDPEPYDMHGIPVLYLMGREGPDFVRCQHADCDRLDIIKPAPLADTIGVEAMVVLSLANAATLPTARLSGAQLSDYLARNKLKH